MLNTSIFINTNGQFSISEGTCLYKIPFDIIRSSARRLFFYNNRNSTTPVHDWYKKLNEYNKKEIQIVNTEEIKY